MTSFPSPNLLRCALAVLSLSAVGCAASDAADETPTRSSALALSQATSFFEGGHAAQVTEPAWVDDLVCTMQSQGVSPRKFLLDGASHPVTANASAMYLVAPIDPSAPQDPGPPAHDHVLAARPTGSANVEVTALLPGPNATATNLATRIDAATGLEMAYAADLGGGLVTLTSYPKIAKAIELGLVDAYPIGLSLVTVDSCR